MPSSPATTAGPRSSYTNGQLPVETYPMEVAYSIIVVNYNGGSKVQNCVASVFKFTKNFEFFLVDNNSTDGSESLIVRQFPKVNLMKNRENVGFAKANNLGIMRARGRWLVLLNPDTVVTANWLRNLTECAALSNQVGILTPKLLRQDGRTIDSTGHVFNFGTAMAFDRGSGEWDTGQYDKNQEVTSCSFACVAIERSVIQTIGLLDEKMILYFEDVDFCIRARIAGWKIVYCPYSVVFHFRGGLTPDSRAPLYRRSIPYPLRIILKCYTARNALKYGSARIARDITSMAAGLKNNDVEYFLGYLRSPLWNLLNLPMKERKIVQSARKVPDNVISTLR